MEQFVEYMGITRDVSNLIEAHRSTQSETKNDILSRILVAYTNGRTNRPTQERNIKNPLTLDIGQGAKLVVGEKMYLFLNEQAKRERSPDGIADVRADGVYVDEVLVKRKKRSYLQPAMEIFQQRLGHYNDSGKLISLNAWLKWHVVRDGKLVCLKDLKDPLLARTRGANRPSGLSLADLGL
jgi:hypothetical protein